MKSLKKLLFLFGFAAVIISCSSRTGGITPAIIQPTPSVRTPNLIESNTPIGYLTSTPEPPTAKTPTAMVILDYVSLASHYLTPLPTMTLRADIPTFQPPWTPQPTPNSLLQVSTRKIPTDWTPTPPPFLPSPPEIGTPYPQDTSNYTAGFIQAATDLMNFTNADQNIFRQYVDTWDSEGRFWFGVTWLLENDFDGDGEPEWLLSIPTYSQFQARSCCEQLIILFEKAEAVYRPVYYIQKMSNSYPAKVLLVDDLNSDEYPEIVVRTMYCGSGCTQYLDIIRWDGGSWTKDYISTGVTDIISFIDYNNDGKTEIIFDYRTIYKLDTSYPERKATDIYGWENGKLVLSEQFLSHNTEPYAVMRDVFSAISDGNIDQALELAQPTIDKIAQSCAQMETYTAIEVMLVYGIQGKPEAMQSTLAQINTYCNQPDNGFTHAANILWQAYQQVHDPIIACQAMKNFYVDEENKRINGTNGRFHFFDGRIWFPNPCPMQSNGG